MALDWDDIRIFLEIERTGRLSRAAKRLGVSHTTVARRLKNFEEQRGCHLFEPSETGLTPTEAGQLILSEAQSMERAAQGIAEKLGRYSGNNTGRVRVGAPDGFGNAVLSHILPELIRAEPGCDVELVPVPSTHKLWRRDVDIAISLDRPLSGQTVMRKLIDYDLRLYAHPEFFAGAERPQSRSDLQAFPFVGYIDELLYTPELDFNHLVHPGLNVVYKAATVKAQFDAVQQGIGLGVLPCFMARGSGLMPVLPEDIAFTRTYWLLFPEEYKSLARIRRVSDFIYEKTQAWSERFRFDAS